VDYRTDAEVLLDHLRDLAKDIQEAAKGNSKRNADIGALAGAQLLFIERFLNAEKQANAEAIQFLWAKYQELGLMTDRGEFDRLFPAETKGRLAPPERRVFSPNVAPNSPAFPELAAAVAS
jgi:hypothetical protein